MSGPEWSGHKYFTDRVSDEAEPITIETLRKLMADLEARSYEAHRHMVNPKGGWCMCGVYISADDLRAAGFEVPS